MRSKIIPGLKGCYAITDEGGVVNTKTGRVLVSHVSKSGYENIAIYISKGKVKNFRIHRLVADAFVNGESNVRNHVNHIDGNKLNNHYQNLEWCSRSENMRHAIRSGLVGKRSHTPEHSLRDIKIKNDYINTNMTHRDIAKKYNLSKSRTSVILRGIKKLS